MKSLLLFLGSAKEEIAGSLEELVNSSSEVGVMMEVVRYEDQYAIRIAVVSLDCFKAYIVVRSLLERVLANFGKFFPDCSYSIGLLQIQETSQEVSFLTTAYHLFKDGMKDPLKNLGEWFLVPFHHGVHCSLDRRGRTRTFVVFRPGSGSSLEDLLGATIKLLHICMLIG